MPEASTTPRIIDDYDSRRPWRTLYLFLGARWWTHLALLALHFVKMSPLLLLPLVISESIRIAEQPGEHPWKYLVMIYVGFVGISLLNIPLNIFFARSCGKIYRGMEQRVRAALVRRLQMLSLSFHETREAGRLQSKTIRDVEEMVRLSEMYFHQGMASVLGILWAFGYTLARDPTVAIVYIVLAPICLLIIRVFRHPMGRRNDDLRRHFEAMSQRVTDMIRMIPFTRMHGLEKHEETSVGERLGPLFDRGLRVDTINAFFGACSFVSFMIAVVAVTGCTTWLVLEGRLTLDKIALYAALFQMVVSSLTGLMGMGPHLARCSASIRSVGEVLECDEIEANEGRKVVGEARGSIAFKNVSTASSNPRHPALRDISLTIKPGECVALIGRGTDGADLLPGLASGFIDPVEGTIELDGHERDQIDLRIWRTGVASIPRQPVMFPGTLRQNLLYGIDDRNGLEHALHQALLDEFIQRLPDGLDTWVGEKGPVLSPVQCQHLAIASAMLRNPKLIIFQEVSGKLAGEDASALHTALRHLFAGRTVLMIPCRQSTFELATRSLIFREGRIVFDGDAEAATRSVAWPEGSLEKGSSAPI